MLVTCGAAYLIATPNALAEPAASPAPAQTNALPAVQPDKSGRRGHHGGGKLSIEKLTAELNLTPEQQGKIKPILDSARAERKQLRQNTASKEEMRPQMKQLRQKTRDQINAILTPEQQQKFAQLKKEHRARGGKDAPAKTS